MGTNYYIDEGLPRFNRKFKDLVKLLSVKTSFKGQMTQQLGYITRREKNETV